MTPGQAVLAGQLRRQGAWCQGEGEALYAELLEQAAADVERGGPCWVALSPFADEPLEHALPLRFLAAVHRLVLTGLAPSLAPYYRSAGGRRGPEGAWPHFEAAVEEHAGLVRTGTAQPCQTNEVGRAAALLPGFLTVAQASGRPLRMLEVGCSAGLNLRFDHFWYGGWGDPSSPVRLDGMYDGDPPRRPKRVRVSERAGCDLHPVDPTTDEGEMALASFTWPDDTRRLERLRGAVRLAREIPAEVDRADAVGWLEARLNVRRARLATVVYHSIFLQYLPPRGQVAVKRVIEQAARGAVADAPLAWVRMEPGRSTFEVRCALWPGGRDVLLGTCGPHGRGFRWAP